MPPTSRFAAPIAVLLLFVSSRLLFQPVSLGVGSVSLRGDVLARAAAALEGRLFNAATLGNGMPLLDRQLLLHDLGRSLWYLHSQPPLFNLFVAMTLRLPGDFSRNYQWINWFFGLLLYLGTYFLMRRLHVDSWIAAGAVILFMLNPNALWMESAVYYGLPLALLLLLAALSWERAMDAGSVRWLAVASVLVVLLPLTRAFFTSIWCAIVLFYFGTAFAQRHARSVRALIATSLPFLLVVAFQLKQAVLFGEFLGSSWFGCNLAAMTASMSADKARDLAEGRVSPLVNVYRNAPPEQFLPYFPTPPTGVPALDQLAKSTGQPNFNHIVYIAVGKAYLRDTLYLIAHHPHKYLLNVLNSIYILSGYQIGVYFDYPRRFFARWSWQELAAPFVGFFLLVVALGTAWQTYRRGDRDQQPLVAFLGFNIVYVMAVSCLFEKSEGAIYRFQVDAFLWSFLAIAAQKCVPLVLHRLHAFKSWPPITSPSDVRN